MVEYAQDLQEVLEKKYGLGGDYLRNLLVSTRSLEMFPGDIVLKLLFHGDQRKLPLTKP